MSSRGARSRIPTWFPSDNPSIQPPHVPNNGVSNSMTSSNLFNNITLGSDINIACMSPPVQFDQNQYSPPAGRSNITTPPLIGLPPKAVWSTQSLLLLSDDDIGRQFTVPQQAYIEAPGSHTVSLSWNAYLELNGYRHAFQPLRGVERDRYRPIIEEAEAEDTQQRLRAGAINSVIERGREAIMHGLMMHSHAPPPQYSGLSGPNNVAKETRKQQISDAKTLDKGYRTIARHIKQGSRHTMQYPAFSKAHYKTRFGVLETCCVVSGPDWYVGHRPGDPIVRVHPMANRGGIPEDDMFYVPELAGTEDRDEIETYDVSFEGVVPFNGRELYQRFTRYALPAFMQMVIAVVGFDPRDATHDAHPWAKRVDHLRTAEFEEITPRERSDTLKLLRKIWRAKYGTDTSTYPEFLRSQVASSISSLREMGWLMSRLERDAPNYTGHHYWNHCKGLLQDFTGQDGVMLAQEHCEITLAKEAEEQLMDGNGNADNMLVYMQSAVCRDTIKLQDFYNPRGPGTDVSPQYIKGLIDIAKKYLGINGHREHSRRHPRENSPPNLSNSSNIGTSLPAATTNATTGWRTGSNKRKTSIVDRDHDHAHGHGHDSAAASLPKRRKNFDATT